MKTKIYLQVIMSLGLAICFYSCAKTGSLSGGPKDTTPPVLITEKSTANYLVNFSESKIVLHFDEYIKLKNLSKEILISPPMVHVPEFNQRGKKITIRLNEKEVLKKDATYSIQFGKSIVDLNEGNVLNDFKYIFATGDKLDSLTISGKVVDAFDFQEEVGEVYLMLYDILEDSIVTKERPFYVVKTKKDGSFRLENLRSDTFKIIALDDINFNLMFDLDSERIGFLDELIILTDSTNIAPTVKLFRSEEKAKVVSKNSRSFGLVTHVMNIPMDSTSSLYTYFPSEIDIIEDRAKDTIRLWYTETPDSIMYSIGTDTMTIYPPLRDSLFIKDRVKVYIGDNTFAPWSDLNLVSSVPILSVDTSLFSIFETINNRTKLNISVKDSITLAEASIGDSTDILQVKDSTEIDSLVTDTLHIVDTTYVDYQVNFRTRSLQINGTWNSKQDYSLYLFPGAVTDIYGRNNDTIKLRFAIKDTVEFGSVNITVDGLNDTINYVLRLMSEDKELHKFTIRNTKSESIKWERIPIGKYSIQLIEDIDKNGKWSTGDYWTKRQPEKIKRESLQPLESGWDLEAFISWDISNDSLQLLNPVDSIHQKLLDKNK